MIMHLFRIKLFLASLVMFGIYNTVRRTTYLYDQFSRYEPNHSLFCALSFMLQQFEVYFQLQWLLGEKTDTR